MSDHLTISHDYVSTACLHDLCGSCRNTCKFCGSPCQHACHPQTPGAVAAPVDEARNVAIALLALLGEDIARDAELARRVQGDPALFWLRGEVQPPGEWAPEGTTP